MMSAISNRREKDKKKRARFRKRLQAAGVPDDQIENIIAIRREDDRAARHGYGQELGPTREEILASTDDSLWPDDTGYKPSPVDPLLNGAGRVTGVTARVARRRNTITRFQYNREADSGGLG